MCWRLGTAADPLSPRLTPAVLTLLRPACSALPQPRGWQGGSHQPLLQGNYRGGVRSVRRAGPAACPCWPPLPPARALCQGLGEAPVLVPRGCWSMLGLLLLHLVAGLRCLDTLVHTLPAGEQPGPALPGKATSSPPFSSSSSHPEWPPCVYARSCCLLAALRQRGCWWCMLGGGSGASKRWLLCKITGRGHAVPQQHLCPVAAVPPPAVARQQKSPAHLCARCGSTSLPGDRCHGTRVTLGVHPMVLAAHSAPGASAGTSSPTLVHMMGCSSGLGSARWRETRDCAAGLLGAAL